MEKIESIEEFFKRKVNWLPANLQHEIGHFNVFRVTAKKIRRMIDDVRSKKIGVTHVWRLSSEALWACGISLCEIGTIARGFLIN